MSSAILLVEDDATIGASLADVLRRSGYHVEWCVNGADAMRSFSTRLPDIVLLDAGLPDIDGFTICRWMRNEQTGIPILIVTARDSDIDIVVGLDAGANDYVVKPFSVQVLLARVRAHLRARPTGDATIVIGELRVDPAAHRVYLDDVELDLRPKEFELLVILVRDAGKVITRDRLLSEVWDLHWDSSTKTLDMHIHALRRKLLDDPGTSRWITTIRGIGYRFETP
ncbi:MAG: response regulator transcription factor [Ilumatobacteraceae bacterium]